MAEVNKDEVEAAVRQLVAAIMSGRDPNRPDDEVKVIIEVPPRDSRRPES
jgi:hypothetical protein